MNATAAVAILACLALVSVAAFPLFADEGPPLPKLIKVELTIKGPISSTCPPQ